MTEQLIEGLSTLDQHVLEHSRHWLLTGIYLRCTACGAGQKASEGNLPFVHDLNCSRAGTCHHPWHNLAYILHWVPGQYSVAVQPRPVGIYRCIGLEG